MNLYLSRLSIDPYIKVCLHFGSLICVYPKIHTLNFHISISSLAFTQPLIIHLLAYDGWSQSFQRTLLLVVKKLHGYKSEKSWENLFWDNYLLDLFETEDKPA